MTFGKLRRQSCDQQKPIESLAGIGTLAKLEGVINKLAKKSQESEKFKNITIGMTIGENLALQYALYAFFVGMGWKPAVGDKVTVAMLIRKYNLRRTNSALLQSLLTRLESIGILTRMAGAVSWTVSKLPPQASDILSKIKQIQTELINYPECSTEIEFLSQTGSKLYQVLRGKLTGLDVLFPPETSPDFQYGAQELYANSVLMEITKTIYIAHGVLEVVLRLVAQGQKEIRILEIGGGTGSTAIPVLKALSVENPNAVIKYTFTDISNFFVGKSKEKIESMFPGIEMEFKSLDIEEEQKKDVGKYDIVMAADVFHATQYLDDTLKNTRALLKPGGIIVLGEIFKSTMFLDVTFGLTEGWWRFADEIRSDSPLISNADWELVLKKYGCTDVFSVTNGTYGVVFAQADSA